MAEVNGAGDVNVSCFPGRSPGCGGFIDISQSARAVVFVGTFTSGGLAVDVEADAAGTGRPRLRIVREGRHRKFRAAVVEKTFAGCSGGGRPVLYVTERAVFRLVEDAGTGAGTTALELAELAPGVDLEADVLAHMDFRPRLPAGGVVGAMDARCFAWALEGAKKGVAGARGLAMA
jgi:propionate CoA-transferase